MQPQLSAEIAKLDDMSVAQLRAYHLAVFGEPTCSRHRIWLVKRIAFKLQEQAEGGLTERALAKAAELGQGMSFRQARPAENGSTAVANRQKIMQIPAWGRDGLVPGMVLRREYKGRTIIAEVREDGFEHEGTVYKSLSALANAVTGSRWNGYVFFGLKKRGQTA